MIKESLDKKFGSSWHAVVGEGYGFELTHEVKNLLYMYFGGTVAVCVWKCSWNDHYSHEDFICCWQNKTKIKSNIACFEGDTEIVSATTVLRYQTRRVRLYVPYFEDKHEVNLIIEFLGIVIRRGLAVCSDLLFHQSIQNTCTCNLHLVFGSYFESLFFHQHLGIVSWMSSLKPKLHWTPNSI